MILFFPLFTFVIVQRLIELFIAKRNEKWMKSQGAYEVGASHYPWMVGLHVSFFITLLLEVLVTNRELSPFWVALLLLFFLAQVGRIWALTSLGKFWNTKIIILPGADVVQKGPYKWIRHPNYVIVTAELLILPLIFQAYLTASVFLLLNAWMLSVRIPTEEQALRELTNYSETFKLKNVRT